MKNFINKNLKSIIFFIAIAIIVFLSYFIDEDLSKVLGVAGFFTWFLREYSKQLLAKDLEKFKAELQNESIKFKITYEKLHTEKAEVIKNFYQQMARINKKINSSLLTLNYNERGKGKTNYNQIAREYDSFVNYYEENKLYFENNLQQKIEEMLQVIMDIFLIYGFLKFNQIMFRGFDKDSERITEKEFNKTKNSLTEQMKTDVSQIKNSIEKKFKNIIGIKE